MTAPLRLPDYPTTGPTGERDNLERLSVLLGALLPPGRVLVVEVVHDDGCPCDDGRRPTSACTCDTVDVTLIAHDPRTS